MNISNATINVLNSEVYENSSAILATGRDIRNDF